MIELIEPLARVPGVCAAALISDDGVPVAVPGQARSTERAPGDAGPLGDADALAAIAASWFAELTRAAGTLSWGAPRRVSMRAERGTLLLLRTAGAVLVVVLEGGLGHEEVWLHMEGVGARIGRFVRALGDESESAWRAHALDAPPAALPGRESAEGVMVVDPEEAAGI